VAKRKRMNLAEERIQRIGQARDAFLRAAAVLTAWPTERDSHPFALMMGSLGMLRLAQADHGDDVNFYRAEQMVRSCVRREP
jgi:hypothetical protein